MVLHELNVSGFTLYAPDFMAGEQKVDTPAPGKQNNVDILTYFEQKPAHTAKQPFGLIPVLEDGDFTLYGQYLPMVVPEA